MSGCLQGSAGSQEGVEEKVSLCERLASMFWLGGCPPGGCPPRSSSDIPFFWIMIGVENRGVGCMAVLRTGEDVVVVVIVDLAILY